MQQSLMMVIKYGAVQAVDVCFEVTTPVFVHLPRNPAVGMKMNFTKGGLKKKKGNNPVHLKGGLFTLKSNLKEQI